MSFQFSSGNGPDKRKSKRTTDTFFKAKIISPISIEQKIRSQFSEAIKVYNLDKRVQDNFRNLVPLLDQAPYMSMKMLAAAVYFSTTYVNDENKNDLRKVFTEDNCKDTLNPFLNQVSLQDRDQVLERLKIDLLRYYTYLSKNL